MDGKKTDYSHFIESIRTLLQEYAGTSSALTIYADTIATASVKENHLYEDMGYHTRSEFEAFMQEHFPKLAAKRPKNVRWKKFLYDSIGKRAPACEYCPDTDQCFSCTVG